MLIPFKDIVRKYGKPNGILHLGANVGEEMEAYYQAGVEKVIWIEANPHLFPILKTNIRPYRSMGVYTKAFPFCVGDEEKEVTFHISNNAGQSSSYLDLGTHKTAHPEVHYVEDIQMKMERLDKFMNSGPERYWGELDFLNADLQGAELKALIGMGDHLNKFKWAYLEVNKEELYKGCALIGEIDAYMKGFGFKRVETKWAGATGWGDALYIKR